MRVGVLRGAVRVGDCEGKVSRCGPELKLRRAGVRDRLGRVVHLGVLPHAAQPPRLRRHALEPREGRDDDEDALVAEERLALLDPRERVVQAVDEVRPDDEVEGVASICNVSKI